MNATLGGRSVAAGVSVLSVSSSTADAGTVRAFASSVGRVLGLEEDGIDDLKLLLTEVCAQAAGSGTPTTLTIEISGARGVTEVTCTGAGAPPWSTPGAEHREKLIRVLAPELEWHADGTVRFILAT